MTIETDKAVVRRARTDPSRTGKALKGSVTFEMAEARLAAANWFWSEERAEFVHVEEPEPAS